MRPVELKKDIYWVGAVDFDIRKVPADKAESYDAIIKKAESELAAQSANK